MSTKDAQAEAFAEFAGLARTLGHAHRLALLEHVAQGERAVERLAELSGLSVANASQHLQHLKRAGFVQARRNGKQVLYGLGEGPIANLLAALREYAEHDRARRRRWIAESDDKRDGLEAVSRSELLRRLREGSVTLLDVRPREEFELGHLPGAVNIPLAELKRRLGELPKRREIVAYCRGPYCVLSAQAIDVLRAKGLRARRLRDGFPDWKAAGLRVEAAA